MYTVIKRMEVSAAHSLKLSYRSKCENLHGHNWIITVLPFQRAECGRNGGRLQSHQAGGKGTAGSS